MYRESLNKYILCRFGVASKRIAEAKMEQSIYLASYLEYAGQTDVSLMTGGAEPDGESARTVSVRQSS